MSIFGDGTVYTQSMNNATIQAVRAIGSIALRRFLTIVTLVVAIVIIAYLALFGFLIRDNPWWALAIVLALPVMTIVVGLLIGGWLLVRYLRPRALNKSESKAIGSFVSRLGELAELPGTPHFLIVIRLVRDALGRRKNGFIATAVQNSARLKGDFAEIRRFFE